MNYCYARYDSHYYGNLYNYGYEIKSPDDLFGTLNIYNDFDDGSNYGSNIGLNNNKYRYKTSNYSNKDKNIRNNQNYENNQRIQTRFQKLNDFPSSLKNYDSETYSEPESHSELQN